MVINSPGNYWVTISNSAGCMITDSFRIDEKNCDCLPVVPTVFTPNSDGLNDRFVINFECEITFFALKIFNRWGNLIFESQSAEKGWNGISEKGEFPDDVYFYILDYSTTEAVGISRHGSLTLLH